MMLFGWEIFSLIFVVLGMGGYGGEFGVFYDLWCMGGVVVKLFVVFVYEGNFVFCLVLLVIGMMNLVGLFGLGVECWKSEYFFMLVFMGVSMVVSIWGWIVEEFV